MLTVAKKTDARTPVTATLDGYFMALTLALTLSLGEPLSNPRVCLDYGNTKQRG